MPPMIALNCKSSDHTMGARADTVSTYCRWTRPRRQCFLNRLVGSAKRSEELSGKSLVTRCASLLQLQYIHTAVGCGMWQCSRYSSLFVFFHSSGPWSRNDGPKSGGNGSVTFAVDVHAEHKCARGADNSGGNDANPAKRSHCFSCSGFVNHATRLPACDCLSIPSRAKPLDQNRPNTRVENGSSATALGDGCPRGHLRVKATVPSPLNLHCASSSPRQRIQGLNFEPCVPAGGKWYLQKGIRPDASSVPWPACQMAGCTTLAASRI
ncbi:hypothetical protein B0T12DRAFT_190783 [Alternaria alternata]|jgi:hypothetical protein|nr:hypothetical protein B0T12DRAFT_190783 [Alternaria alternata]